MMWLLLILVSGQFETTFRAGLVALNENKLTVAESQLEAASKMEPRDARVWLALAETYSKLHKASSAEQAAKRAETFASDATILRGLAICYSGMGNYGKAIEVARRAIAGADRADLHDFLGKMYAANEDASRAATEFKAAIERDPFVESYYFDLTQLRLKQQDFAQAIEAVDAGRKKFDKSAQLELAAGVAYYGLRRFPEAIDAFLRTIRLDPGVEQSYVFLGRMLDQAEDRLPRIVAALAAFARSAPDNYLSGFLYGKALALEDPAAAEMLLRKSIARNGEYWESHFQLGLLLDQRRKFEEAAAEVKRAAELNPGDPVPHYRLARIYERLGKPANARAELELHEKLAGRGSTTGSVIK